MRHHSAHRKLHREKGQRTALIKSLARSLVLHESIATTEAKAKEVRPFVEKLITSGKDEALGAHRTAIMRLGSTEAVHKIRTDLAKRYATRAGGYTRITRLGRVGKRVGEQVRIELLK